MEQLLSGDLVCAVCDDLVCVHVGLSAASRLPYDEREVLVQASGDDLVACGADRAELFIGHSFGDELVICKSGSLFQDSESGGDLTRHRLDAYADRKILVASFGLRAPIFICGDFYLSH